MIAFVQRFFRSKRPSRSQLRAGSQARAGIRPWLESLEDRLAPAGHMAADAPGTPELVNQAEQQAIIALQSFTQQHPGALISATNQAAHGGVFNLTVEAVDSRLDGVFCNFQYNVDSVSLQLAELNGGAIQFWQRLSS